MKNERIFMLAGVAIGLYILYKMPSETSPANSLALTQPENRSDYAKYKEYNEWLQFRKNAHIGGGYTEVYVIYSYSDWEKDGKPSAPPKPWVPIQT